MFTDDDVKKAGTTDFVTYYRFNNPKSASHLWTIDNYFNNIKIIEELYKKIETIENVILRDQYLHVFFSQFCKNKYNIILRKGYSDEIKRTLKNIRSKHIKKLWCSKLRMKYKIAMHMLSASNSMYGFYLLQIDPTMRTYEKVVKRSN